MSVQCKVEAKNKEKKGFLCFCQPPEDNPFLVIEKMGPQEGTKMNW